MTAPRAQTLQQRMGFVDSDLKTPGHDAIMLWLDEQTTNEQLAVWIQQDTWMEHESAEHTMQDALKDFINSYVTRSVQAQKRLDDSRQTIAHTERLIACPPPPYTPEYYQPMLIEGKREFQSREREVIDTQQKLDEAKIHGAFPDLPIWPGCKVTKKQWEMPVMSGSYTIGFIDFVVHYQSPSLEVDSYAAEYGQSIKTAPAWDIRWLEYHAYFEVKTTIPSLGELLRQLGQYREYLMPKHSGMPLSSPTIFVVSPDTRFATKIREQGFGFIQCPQP